MNEYRVPELNVQNGVLKALAFMFEYIGEMSKDYIYAVTPLLEDAMMDRDLVHRQTAMTAIGHMALGVFGFGCEDALTHLLNHVWPNIFETSPHVIQAFISAIEGLRVGLGAGRVLYYTLQVKFVKYFPCHLSYYCLFFICRVSSIQHDVCVMFTGKFIIHYTSVPKIPLFVLFHELLTTIFDWQ